MRGCASPCGAVVGASLIVVVGGDVHRFLVSSLLLLFSLRVLHLHQLTLPPHCCCVLGWGSLNLAVPRVFAALLLAFFFFVGVCAPTCLCKAPLSPRVVFLCVPPELFSCARGTCLLCMAG